MNKENLVTAGVIVALVLGVLAISNGGDGSRGPQGPQGDRGNVGAFPGPDIYQKLSLNSGVVTGGVATTFSTTSDAATYTLTRTELCGDTDYIEWNAGLNITITSPATTTGVYGCMFDRVETGKTKVYRVYSATGTAATTITYAAGVGVDLQEDEGATVIQNGLEIAELVFLRKASGDVIQWVRVGQVGD